MKTTRLITTFFLFFLFLIPLQTIFFLREPFIGGEKWQYGTIGLYGTDILLLFLIILSATAYWKRNIDLRFMIYKWRPSFQFLILKSKIKNHISETLLGMFLLWVGLSIFWAGDQILALYFFVKLLLAVGLFAFVRSREIDVKKIVWVLILLGVLQSGIGIAQFLGQKSIESSILGMSSYDAYQAGSSVLKIDSGRFLRAYGTFPHPNMLGGFLGVILVLGIAYYVLFIRYVRSWGMARDILFLLTSIIVIFLGLLLTFSRSAWLGVGVGIFVLGIVVFLQKEWDVRIRFFKILIALGLAVTVFGSLLSEQILPRFDTVTIEREGSVTERVQSFRDASVVIGEGNVLLGTGAGNFTARMISLQPERPIWSIQPVHNVFVLVFTELGLVGFVLFLFFLFSLIKNFIAGLDLRLQRASKSLDSRLLGDDTSENLIIKKENILFGIALLVLIPSLFLDHFLWSSH
ncbi:MAG: O-antigen ligase family protein, partial [Candidatus Moranbacteria bacterium]|nr:O-antigen ligase family protein [Candidatus Moranbacteria bacterium]